MEHKPKKIAFLCHERRYTITHAPINLPAGRWLLAVNATEYLHGSAKYYLTGVQGLYEVANFIEMEDVGFKEGRQ